MYRRLSVEDIAAVGGSSACTGTIRGRDTSCVVREKRENLGKLAPPCAWLLRKPRSALYSGDRNVILQMHGGRERFFTAFETLSRTDADGSLESDVYP